MKCIRSCLVVFLLLEGCAANDGLGTDSAAQINISHLACLDVGMSEQETLNVMHKPYSRKRFEIDGAVFDVWFYVTEATVLGQTRMVPRNLTPLTFKNGELIGWGYKEYNYLLKRQRALEKNPPPPAPVLVEPAIEESVALEPEENLKHLTPTMAKPTSSALEPMETPEKIQEDIPIGLALKYQAISKAKQVAQNKNPPPPQPLPPQGMPQQSPNGQAPSNKTSPQQNAPKQPANGQGSSSQGLPQQGTSKPPAKGSQPSPQQNAPKQPAHETESSNQAPPQQGASKPPSDAQEPASSKGTSKKSPKGGKGVTGPQSQQPPNWGPIDHSKKPGEQPQAPAGQQGKPPGGQPGGSGSSGSSADKKKGQTALLSMSAKPQNKNNSSSKPSSSGSKANQAPQTKDDKPLLDEEDRRMLEEQSEQNFNQS